MKTQSTLEAIIKRHGITMDARQIPDFGDELSKGVSRWFLTLTAGNGQTYSCEHSQGTSQRVWPSVRTLGLKHTEACEPDCVDVLECLLIAANAVADRTFEEWCEDFGCDADSLKALDYYVSSQNTSIKLKRMFGSHEAYIEAIQAAENR